MLIVFHCFCQILSAFYQVMNMSGRVFLISHIAYTLTLPIVVVIHGRKRFCPTDVCVCCLNIWFSDVM